MEAGSGPGTTAEQLQSTPASQPLISIVVPVYNVEPYVRQCLESIRSQTYDNWEAIVIDDCSTDGSMRVVSDVVATDNRFRVVHLPTNGGLGNARNVGIAEAIGDYVILLDSDDHLELHALDRVAQSIAEASDPDIVWFDYVREKWWGKRTRNIYGHILGDVGPGPTTISDNTELLQILPIAPNKAYRLQYLQDVGFQFAEGLYEDIPFTYPVVLNANSIAIIDEPLYVYRQRRQGSLRQDQSTKHFDVLRQYELMFSRVDYDDLSSDIRGILYKKLIDHFFTIYGTKSGRLPRRSRAKFFHETASVASRFRTRPDRTPLTGMRRLRLLQGDRLVLYRLSEIPGIMRDSVREWYQEHRERSRTRRSRRRTRVKRWFYRHVLVRQRLDPDLALFTVRGGRSLVDNPGAIFVELQRTRPEIRAVWLVSPSAAATVDKDLPTVVKGSWEYYKALAHASYFISDESLPSYFVKRKGVAFLQTLHGTPFETIYTDTRPYAVVSKGVRFGPILKRADTWDYCLSSSAYATETIKRAVPSNFEVLEFGQPRNDILFGDAESVSQEVRGNLGIDRSAHVTLYAPTRRAWERTISSPLDITEFASRLKADAVLLTTVPYPDGDDRNISGDGARVIDVSGFSDINRLCAVADILVTDYSSIMFDYATLNRPIIIYADDYQTFATVRGIYFDLLESPPGAAATTPTELFRLFDSGDYETEETRELLDAFRSRFCEFEDGSASRRVVTEVFR